jgi:hypothetical protein
MQAGFLKKSGPNLNQGCIISHRLATEGVRLNNDQIAAPTNLFCYVIRQFVVHQVPFMAFTIINQHKQLLIAVIFHALDIPREAPVTDQGQITVRQLPQLYIHLDTPWRWRVHNRRRLRSLNGWGKTKGRDSGAVALQRSKRLNFRTDKTRPISHISVIPNLQLYIIL